MVLTSATAQTRGQVSAACQPGVPAAIRPVRLAAEIEARLCQAGKNWAHACLYVRCGVDDDVTDITEARLPPRSGPGDRTLTVQSVGVMVPSWAVFGQR